MVRAELRKRPDDPVNTVSPPTDIKGSSQGRPPSGGSGPSSPHDDVVDALPLPLNCLRPDIRPGDPITLPDGTTAQVEMVTHTIGSNPCGEIALGPAEACTLLGLKPRKVDFPLFDMDFVSVQPMTKPAASWVMGIDDAEPDPLPVPRPVGVKLRPFDPLW